MTDLFNTMFVKFIHIVTPGSNLFILIAVLYFTIWRNRKVDKPLFVCPACTEAGEALEPRRPRLYHCTPHWVTEQDSVSKKKIVR